MSDGVRRTVCFCPSLKNDFHISVFSTSWAKIKPLSTTIIATIRKANSLRTGQEISNIAICRHGNTSRLSGIGVGDNLHFELAIFHCLFIRAFPRAGSKLSQEPSNRREHQECAHTCKPNLSDTRIKPAPPSEIFSVGKFITPSEPEESIRATNNSSIGGAHKPRTDPTSETFIIDHWWLRDSVRRGADGRKRERFVCL